MFTDALFAEILVQSVDDTVSEVTGVDGSWQWRVSMKVTFKGDWHINGEHQVLSPRSAIWYLTIDQTTGQVTSISQPPVPDLGIDVDR